MKQLQIKQTQIDIVDLYECDIGNAQGALNDQLMFERQRKSGPFINLPRKAQIRNTTPNQNWSLHLSIMLNWMHYQTRCIVPLYRRVVFSESLRRSPRPQVIDEIARSLENGRSLKPRVSRAVLKSFKAKELREDPLLWNWNIHHFHLGDYDHGKGYASGTEELMFAYVDQNLAVILGIGTHDDFSESWLLEQLLGSAPELIERFEIKGIKAPESKHQLTASERKQIWRRSVTFDTYEGKCIFPPGMGVVSSGHAGRLVDEQDRILSAIAELDRSNVLGSRDFAPVKMQFNSVGIDLLKNGKVLRRGNPLV